ncbi:MAG: DUF2062 domain-containing protein [Betaproteobacteria bacterium]|nr:DUF2062 domain-containing protein [Betaproteobacteria bacterium]
MRQRLQRYLPSRETLRQNKYFQRYGAFLQHPGLWRLNRRSVSGGFAVGLFSGLVPGPLQMLTAAVIAVPLRVNLPVALATTLYTNPITIGPLYLLAYAYGRLLFGGDQVTVDVPTFDWLNLWIWVEAYAAWALSLGRPLFLGLIALALTLAACGWVLVQVAWRIQVSIAWRRRAARRAGAARHHE